jgi:ParB/RepB/Spo0J family partition protein
MSTITDPIETTTDPVDITVEPVEADEPTPSVEPAAAPSAGELVSLPVDALVPHPDNPRASLGDLDELARSIKAHGILQPLVVLPAGDDGRHLIVTGHRRHAAAIQANATHVPGVVRDLAPAEVVEAMLIENVNRSALTTSEEVKAIERLMDLAAGKLTPARLCKRIGRSQGWARTRMAICALPTNWRQAIDEGELSLGAGEAAASVADLGPEHVEELCDRFSRHSWGDHSRLATEHRQRVERQSAYEAAVAKARRRRGAVVFTSEERPRGYQAVADILDGDEAKAHRNEPCHAVLIERTTYGQGVERTDICTDPKRHAPDEPTATGESHEGEGDEADDGDDVSPWPGRPAPSSEPTGPDLDSPHLKRKGRLARTAYTREVFARSRGGISQAQATRMALRALLYEAGMEALSFAAEVLGIEGGYGLTARLIDQADTPAALARVAGGVAMGIAESRMYNGYNGTPCRDYMTLLTGAGWDPDSWTAAIIDQQTRQAQAQADAEPTEPEPEPEPFQAEQAQAEPEEADAE